MVEAIGIPKPGKRYATKRPTRDEFVLEELGNQLAEAKQEDAEVLLTVWGWDEQVRGRITIMDSRTGKVYIQRHGVTTKVPFMDIMKVGNPSDYEEVRITAPAPQLSHWKLNCSECGANGEDVYKYRFIDIPGGRHITLEDDTMLCDACKQGIIDRAVKSMSEHKAILEEAKKALEVLK